MNKMFKKIFAVVAACATVATMSVSAFAATANHEDGTVSVSGYEAVTGATQYTVMVFSVGADVTDLAEAAPSEVGDIYYINQGTELYDEVNKDGLLDKMLVKATDGENALPAGNYAVRIGNDTGSVVTLGLEVAEESTILYGDVNNNGKVNALDIRDLKRYLNGEDGYDETTLNLDAADVNGNGKVNALDIRDIKRHLNGEDGYETLPVK